MCSWTLVLLTALLTVASSHPANHADKSSLYRRGKPRAAVGMYEECIGMWDWVQYLQTKYGKGMEDSNIDLETYFDKPSYAGYQHAAWPIKLNQIDGKDKAPVNVMAELARIQDLPKEEQHWAFRELDCYLGAWDEEQAPAYRYLTEQAAREAGIIQAVIQDLEDEENEKKAEMDGSTTVPELVVDRPRSRSGSAEVEEGGSPNLWSSVTSRGSQLFQLKKAHDEKERGSFYHIFPKRFSGGGGRRIIFMRGP